ncbi:GNAT family N-acetyltransferase [Paenibacillus harenae]|uniref:GNAT family N-acetyltransferase n=1 Tax=Paenibacillus harenae TaxID=306543 RepID=UPI002793FD89|nr:GNAT family N-acetyltransferase [Paenibacillus harenae]MDQ0059841.1 GNAT superfamily N-acetyltransferase [Paenibacillus harenae]
MLSETLISRIVQSEIDYMTDRMLAIKERPGNPEGIEIWQTGHTTCYYSETMPWASFNTVKGFRGEDIEHLDSILEFYESRGRNAHFELIPSFVDQMLMRTLSERGLYQSGFHASMYATPVLQTNEKDDAAIRIRMIEADEFEVYARIHCRSTGLPNDGIPHVAGNNKVLYDRAGWFFYLASIENEPAAVGVMHVSNRIASFTFAATLPEYRGKGLQGRLLSERIHAAAQQKCELAVAQCAFLSQSHRNMEKAGMRIGYVRASWSQR